MIISHQKENSGKEQGLKLSKANYSKWYGTGKRNPHNMLLYLSEVIRNVRHEGIYPDNLLGKVGSSVQL